MSAHIMSQPPESPHKTIIGWDGPTQTFFVQILGENEYGEETIIDRGKRPGDLPTIAALEAALTESPLTSGIILTPELRQTLETEKACSPKPTELQQRMAETFLF